MDRIPSELLQAYRNTRVFLSVEGTWREWHEVPRPQGTRIHVITAHNPWSERRTQSENEAANARLADALTARGFRFLPAVGRSPRGDWEEASFAVLDAPREEILALGRAFGQYAVFEVGEAGLEVVQCGGRGPPEGSGSPSP